MTFFFTRFNLKIVPSKFNNCNYHFMFLSKPTRALGLKTVRKKVTRCGKGIGGRFVGPRSVFPLFIERSQI